MEELDKEFNGLEGLEVFFEGDSLPPNALAETNTKWMNKIGSEKYSVDKVFEIMGKGTLADGTSIKLGAGDTGLGKVHLQTGGDLEGATIKNFTRDRDAYDNHSHGSHVTCMMAAKPQGSGITGLASDAKVYHAKVLSNSGSGTGRGILNGVQWLADQGCKVISLSLGGGGFSDEANRLYKKLDEQGILVFASIGNSGQGGERGGYPGRYDTTAGIGAVNFNDTVARFSSESEDVDLTGYGVDIYSCGWRGYTGMSGTSMSCPYVAGNAVRHIGYFDRLGIKVKNMAHYYELVKPAIKDLSTPGKDRYFGRGIIVDSLLIDHYGIPEDKPKDPVIPVPVPVDPIDCPVHEVVGSLTIDGVEYDISKKK